MCVRADWDCKATWFEATSEMDVPSISFIEDKNMVRQDDLQSSWYLAVVGTDVT